MEEEEHAKKPLNLNWDKLFSKKENGAPAELVVVPKEDQQEMEYISTISDHDLKEKIKRVGSIFCLGTKLPDKGEKLRKNLKLCEEELERRNQSRLIKEAECEKANQSRRSCSPGACNGFSSQAPPPQNQSKFTKSFSQVLDDEPDMDTRISINQHDKALHLGGGNYQSTKSNGCLSKSARKESKASLKLLPSRCSKASNREGYEHRSVGERKTINSSSFYRSDQDGKYSSLTTKRRSASPDQISHQLRTMRRQARVKKQRETVVLLDEEDCQMTEGTDREDESNERMEDKIYYPTRDDPECVELHFSDINCLAPEVYLSSPIMNFYIRYLQLPGSATSKSRSDYLIFNTYFYGKIKEAVLCKEMHKETFFSKFRRWWKGVNIFEKAYILFPIHENFHWSLVIICLPDKEDESGPLLLHLDSLGYHVSSHIFNNVKSFLSLEWNYLKEKEALVDLPMAEKVWKHLPRRITDKRIMVPQQKNDYDCGVFVLFFMQHFIKQAPDRLRRHDDDMFGREWFKPEEASRLRKRIRKLLKKEFREASREEASPTLLSENDSGASHSVEDSATSVDFIEQLD